jgi:gas vesicle protein
MGNGAQALSALSFTRTGTVKDVIMDNSQSNSLLALLAGVAIGAGLGILFAPDSGENTRRKIKDGAEGYGDELKSQLNALNEKIRSSVAQQGEHLSDELDSLADVAGEETELMIAKLEARLEQLKSRLSQSRA